MDYDCNHKKRNNLSVERLKKLEELMKIYGPLNEFGYPEKVTAISVSYYTAALKVRMEAIENICACIRMLGEKWDLEALRKEKTSILEKISDIINNVHSRTTNEETFSLTDIEKETILYYSIKEMNFNPDEEEEFLSEEELESAYGEEDYSSVNKRLGSNFIK